MYIFNRLNPDEEEFYDYFINNKSKYLKDFIDEEEFRVDFTGMLPEERVFVVGFSSNHKYPHELPEYIITFKVNHNHGHYLVYNVSLEKMTIEELEDNNMFFIKPMPEYESILI